MVSGVAPHCLGPWPPQARRGSLCDWAAVNAGWARGWGVPRRRGHSTCGCPSGPWPRISASAGHVRGLLAGVIADELPVAGVRAPRGQPHLGLRRGVENVSDRLHGVPSSLSLLFLSLAFPRQASTALPGRFPYRTPRPRRSAATSTTLLSTRTSSTCSRSVKLHANRVPRLNPLRGGDPNLTLRWP